ncbi:MAG TPA: Tm-1-like ATP-binding domain-containing protein, partial [Thermomicrobiales bacterium]|nr:Tm-1-like ATP-binding domain-containing protein [Thermomicrobiales bacterium]
DMVNFGPKSTVPEQFRTRNLYVHNPNVTLMRTTPEENAELGRQIAEKLNAATGPVALYLPRRGVSLIATEGQPFHDADADSALYDAILANIGPNVEVHDLDLAINDEQFATAMADRLHELIASR